LNSLVLDILSIICLFLLGGAFTLAKMLSIRGGMSVRIKITIVSGITLFFIIWSIYDYLSYPNN